MDQLFYRRAAFSKAAFLAPRLNVHIYRARKVETLSIGALIHVSIVIIGIEKMIEQNPVLGKLISSHGVSNAFTQRALIVAIMSFVFFIAMLVMFSYRQNIGYFLLGTAFLIVEIFTLIGWFIKRKTTLFIFEKGFIYKDKPTLWEEVAETKIRMNAKLPAKVHDISVLTKDGNHILLNDMIEGLDDIINVINARKAKNT